MEKQPHEPPHNRFFEDGEEPPDRYDLDDELDYVLAANFPLSIRSWLRTARTHYWPFCRRSATILLGYIPVWLFGWHPGICWIFTPFEPILLAALTLKAMKQITEESPVRKRRLYAREYFPLLLINIFLVIEFCMFAVIGGMAMVTGDHFFGEDGNRVTTASLIATAILLFALNCRLFRFAPYFIVDQEMGLIQSIRGSWRLWKGKSLSSFGLEIISLVLQFAGFLSLGVGLVFVKPFTSLFWTAVYLDSISNLPYDRNSA